MVQRSWRIAGGTALVDGALRPADIALAAGRMAETAPGMRACWMRAGCWCCRG